MKQLQPTYYKDEMNKTNTILKVFLLFGTMKVNLILLPTDFFSPN